MREERFTHTTNNRIGGPLPPAPPSPTVHVGVGDRHIFAKEIFWETGSIVGPPLSRATILWEQHCSANLSRTGAAA
jgi:hypothetical protein